MQQPWSYASLVRTPLKWTHDLLPRHIRPQLRKGRYHTRATLSLSHQQEGAKCLCSATTTLQCMTSGALSNRSSHHFALGSNPISTMAYNPLSAAVLPAPATSRTPQPALCMIARGPRPSAAAIAAPASLSALCLAAQHYLVSNLSDTDKQLIVHKNSRSRVRHHEHQHLDRYELASATDSSQQPRSSAGPPPPSCALTQSHLLFSHCLLRSTDVSRPPGNPLSHAHPPSRPYRHTSRRNTHTSSLFLLPGAVTVPHPTTPLHCP